MTRAFAGLSLLVSFGIGACASCSRSSETVPDADAATDSAVEVSIPDRQGRESGVEYDPDGWLRLDFDPDVDCGFYTAPRPDKMPPPIDWEPCPDVVATAGYSCRKIKVTWPAPTGAFAKTPMTSADGWTDQTGRPILVVSRFTGARIFRIVANADGAVRAALVENDRNCTLGTSASVNGRFVYTAIRGTKEAVRWGAIGGELDVPARVLESWSDGRSHEYVAGPNTLFDNGRQAIRTWTTDASATVLSVTDPGQLAEPQFQGDAFFFTVANLAYARVKIFTGSGGLKDFVSFGNDVSKNAADLGTDGVDMVWIEATGRTSQTEDFSTVDVMAAPFTTDPGSLARRRVRSALGHSVGVSKFVVGCGYAAREFSLADGPGVQLVRLADGRSWRIREVAATPFWTWTRPITLTCDELFLNVTSGEQFHVARVRIDSLGPGEPAD